MGASTPKSSSIWSRIVQNWRDNNGNVLLATALSVVVFACVVGYFELIPALTSDGAASDSGSKFRKVFRMVVDIRGFASDEGVCVVTLHNVDGPSRAATPFRSAQLAIENKQVVWELFDVPYGEYAIVAFHDVNEDGELSPVTTGPKAERRGHSVSKDPLEPRPFTTEAIEALFNEARFEFASDSQLVEIQLH